MKLAIVHREKCRPEVCGRECKKYCPVEKQEADSFIVIGGSTSGHDSGEPKCVVDENSCVG